MAVDRTGLELVKIKARVDLSEPDAREQVQAHGLRVTWELAAECPCVTKMTVQGATGETEEGRTDCPECHGTRIMYVSPTEIRAVFAQFQVDPTRHNRAGGEYARGRVLVTVLPEHVPGHLDRYTMRDAVMRWRETKTRRLDVEGLNYPIARPTITYGTPGDPTTPREVTEGVLYCRKADANGVLLGDELVEGVDFEVTAEGRIDWALGDGLGTAPATGTRYSVIYHAHPRWICLDQPYAVRNSWIKNKTISPTQQTFIITVECGLQYWGGQP